MDAEPEKIVLRIWGRRLIAWFVDYVIINIMLAYFRLEDLETALFPPFLLPHLPGTDISAWSPLSVLVFFVYWTLSEWYFGRSIGQLLLNLRLVDLKGRNPALQASAIQSVGKSLLLPIDLMIGWIYKPCREQRQRFFNRLSNTIVIFIGSSEKLIKEKGEYPKEP